MADEITITTSLSFVKGNVSESLSDTSLTRDVSGTKYVKGVQNVGFASEEALDMGDILTGATTSPGYAFFRNLDATNFVTIRGATGIADTVKLLPGDVALFRLAADAPFVQADAAAVNLEYLIIEA